MRTAVIDFELYTEKKLSDTFRLYWRILKEHKELEVVMVANGTSYVAIGWRPKNLTKLCKNFFSVGSNIEKDSLREPNSEPDSKPEPKSEPETKSEPEPEPKSELNSESKTELEPRPTSEPEPEPKSEPEPESKSEPEPESKGESKTDLEDRTEKNEYTQTLYTRRSVTSQMIEDENDSFRAKKRRSKYLLTIAYI